MTTVTTNDASNQPKIPARHTFVDGCPVLPKLQCHEVKSGQAARLEWQLKTDRGELVKLTSPSNSQSESQSQSTSGETAVFDAIGTPAAGVTLRMREITGCSPEDLIHAIPVTIVDADRGTVISDRLPDAIVRGPGIYIEEWAVFDDAGQMLFSNQCSCFVRRGLFGLSTVGARDIGPPTIEEIRLSLRDSSPIDNPLLDNVEFDAAEIAQAVVRPLQFWNEASPPLRPEQTTKTFPFRELWLRGIQAYLFEIAANHYRRNHLAYAAGGVSIEDKNKEQAYSMMGMSMLEDFRNAVRLKKLEINTTLFSGHVSSQYGHRCFY